MHCEANAVAGAMKEAEGIALFIHTGFKAGLLEEIGNALVNFAPICAFFNKG